MNDKKRKRWPLSRISTLHYFKLTFRFGLFLAAVVIYIINRIRATGYLFGGIEKRPIILVIIWLIFVIEMILRFFPSKYESMGCQKQFLRNYIPSSNSKVEMVNKKQSQTTFAVAAVWIILNAAIGVLYYGGIINEGILLLISLAYSVCDMICILFFCPFHTWIMKNKCCTSCRIYNWDYAMMFTPLIFVKSIYTWSILALALALLIKWEIIHRLYPERFMEATNAGLSCTNCQEKLCHHKKSLQSFLRKHREHYFSHKSF